MTRGEIPERYNASLLLDSNLEAGRGGKVAIHWADAEVTYSELFDRMCKSGRALAELGVNPGDRVLMVLDDRPEFPTIFLGAIRAGAVPVPVNPLYDPEDYAYFVKDSEARILIVDPARADKLRAALGGSAGELEILTTGGPIDGLRSFDEVVAGHTGDLSPAGTHRDDMAFWLYSSGSTGSPKGVVHLQHDILSTCETYAKHALKIEESDLTFSSTKLFHAYGLGNNLSFPYWAGASTVLLSGRPTPDALFETIERFKPTLFFSVPTLYNAVLNSPGAENKDVSSVRACVSAAEPLPAEVWHRWKKMFDLVILDGIGSTELLHIYCSNTLDDHVPGSSGKPVPGYELEIRGDNDEVLRGEAQGNLYVKGDSSLAYYWNKPDKTEECLRDGWFFSGDRYRRDSEGYYWYEGRADDMFKVSGLWVSPAEVEGALLEHPSVVEAAVVAASVEGFTNAKAFVIPRDPGGADDSLKQDLATFCEKRLHRYQQPRIIEFVDDLPRTVTGKIQRFKLREAG